MDGHWEPELNNIEVEFHLFNRLAIGYRTKKNTDLSVEWLLNNEVRRVVRRIHNTFWFFREVRRYGADCEIVGPPDVRARFAQDLEKAVQRYQ